MWRLVDIYPRLSIKHPESFLVRYTQEENLFHRNLVEDSTQRLYVGIVSIWSDLRSQYGKVIF